MSKKALAMLVAELVGTFVLATVVLSINRYGLPIFTAMAGGVVFATLMLAVGPVSGAHFNPATTIGWLTMKKISIIEAISYVGAQAVGAVLAWKLYEWFADKDIRLAATEFDWKVFTAELLGMAVFAFAITAAAKRKLDAYPAAVVVGSGFFIGATLASLVASAGSINPAVAISLGFRPENSSYYAYLFGPIAGAIIGMNFYRIAFTDEKVFSLPAKVVAAKPVVKKSAPVSKKSSAKKKK
jgi:glycerol uptake facilitator-like aquaporin